MTDTAPTIVAAAIRIIKVDPSNGHFRQLTVSAPPPARHHTLLNPLSDLEPHIGFIGPEDQGFLTSEGMFADRKTAAKIAIDAGQITELKFQKYELFSEDLW